jgi:Flp pilus assembly protein protease CpaA
MAIGAVRGTSFLFAAAVYGAIIGGIIAVGFIVTRRLLRPVAGAEAPTVGGLMKKSIPYGIALGLGGLLALALEAGGVINTGVL